MLFSWLEQLEFEHRLTLIGLFLLGVACGCGGVLLVQWLMSHVAISVR